MSDITKSITKTEQEIVYIVSVSSNGEFSSDFVGLIELGADRTAQAITDGLVRLFQDTGLDDWTTKLVAVCSDGAAVNFGVYNGVVPKLQRLAAVGDSFVHVLCTAHTLENWVKSADRNVPYSLMHIHLSKQTTETFDPKQAVDLWMETANRRLNQGQGGASAASSSSTMQEAEAVDNGGDTVEDSGGDTEDDSEEDCTLRL
ncbi:unnamed protein product [Arctogadus glacialis]